MGHAPVHVCFEMCWVCSVYSPRSCLHPLCPALCPGWLTWITLVNTLAFLLPDRFEQWEEIRRSEGRSRVILGVYSFSSSLLGPRLLAPSFSFPPLLPASLPSLSFSLSFSEFQESLSLLDPSLLTGWVT